MLSLIVFSLDQLRLQALSASLERCVEMRRLPAVIGQRLVSVTELLNTAQAGSDIAAYFLCHDHASQAGETLLAIRTHDRLSYAIVVANSAQGLQDILRPGLRLSALLIEPVRRDKLLELLDELIEDSRTQPKTQLGAFEVKIKGCQHFIPMESILFFEARDKRIRLRTKAQQIEFHNTLQALASGLPDMFLRVHNAFIVNIANVAAVEYKAREIVFQNGMRIPFSRTYKPDLQNALARQKDKVMA